MKIIHRYVLAQFLKIWLLALLSFTSIYLVVDFFEKIDNFLESGLSLGRAIQFFIASAPFVVFQMAPVAVLVGVLIAVGLLARDSEIVAMKAGGISLAGLSAPLVLAALAISALMFLLSETVIPETSTKANAIWNVEVEKDAAAGSRIKRDIWLRASGGIFHFEAYDQDRERLEGVSGFFFGKGFRLEKRIVAESARPVDGKWELFRGQVKTFGPPGDIRLESFDRRAVDLPPAPQNYDLKNRSADEMSSRELWVGVNRMAAEGYDSLRHRVEFQMKFSFPFICVVMAFLGLPIAFWKEKGGGIALGIAAGIGLSFAYLVVLGLSRALGYAGLLAPLAAAWLPNLLFLTLGLFLFSQVRQ
ncbi:MAG: LPS export ABC transporter permease LptG [Pseudomonadota bacterium]